ncbi:MAG TPA: RDD family protein [Acidimicrobiales bacterium]|nr:RDD family protein [Acidimicrobiales bacterium]
MQDAPPSQWAQPGPALAAPIRRMGGFLVDQAIFAVVGGIVLYRAGAGTSPAIGSPVYDRSALIVYGLELAYELVLLAVMGQTIGCLAVGVKVVRQEDAGLPGWSRAARRVATASLPAVIPVVGLVFLVACYGWMFRDPRRQGLHDKAAGTIVIDVRRARRYDGR